MGPVFLYFFEKFPNFGMCVTRRAGEMKIPLDFENYRIKDCFLSFNSRKKQLSSAISGGAMALVRQPKTAGF